MNSIAKKVFTHPIHLLAFGFGSGLLPKAPGTFGTIVGVVIYSLLKLTRLSFFAYLVIVFLLTITAIWICDWSSRDLHEHDYPGIVLDEIVGFLWVMVGVPFQAMTILLGFLLFRLFDVWKPWPIRWLDQHIKGGLGIVIDDLMAALYSWIILQILLFM